MCTHAAQAREPGPRSRDVSRAVRGLLVLVRGDARYRQAVCAIYAGTVVDYVSRAFGAPRSGVGERVARVGTGWGCGHGLGHALAGQRAREDFRKGERAGALMRPLGWARWTEKPRAAGGSRAYVRPHGRFSLMRGLCARASLRDIARFMSALFHLRSYLLSFRLFFFRFVTPFLSLHV